MNQHREDLRHLMVAGTITFPSTFPNLGLLSFEEQADLADITSSTSNRYLCVTEETSVGVTIKRKVPVSDVRAVFVPRDCRHVRIDDGTWLLGSEIEQSLSVLFRNSIHVRGIVYVAETTATLLEVRAGMTAAESAQYYPPIACDRSNNHYNPGTPGAAHPFSSATGVGQHQVSAQQVPSNPYGQAARQFYPQHLLECESYDSPHVPRRFECESYDSAYAPRRFECESYESPYAPRRFECDSYSKTEIPGDCVVNPQDPHLAPFKGFQWQRKQD